MSDNKLTNLLDQGKQSQPQDESGSCEDSDSDMFTNLAPSSFKNSNFNSKNQSNELMMAKMKRLIGANFMERKIDQGKRNTVFGKSKPQNERKRIIKKPYNQVTQQQQQKTQSTKSMQENRERSRNKKHPKLKEQAEIQVSEQIEQNQKQEVAAILSVQKQVVKQNHSLNANKAAQTVSQQASLKQEKVEGKFSKFSQMERHLFIPIDQLPASKKTEEQIKQLKRQKKRFDRMVQKKLKEYKVGKAKDQVSNSLFNRIEDYFM